MPEDLRSRPEPVLSTTTTNQRRRTAWNEHAKRLLKAEMERHGYSYKSLARQLGGAESDESLMTRINRGTFSVAFFLQALRVMGTKSIDISHLPDGHQEATRKK